MAQLLIFLGLGIYIWGGLKFWQGFRRTNFAQNRLPLTLLWPVLALFSPSYRENFQKALRLPGR